MYEESDITQWRTSNWEPARKCDVKMYILKKEKFEGTLRDFNIPVIIDNEKIEFSKNNSSMYSGDDAAQVSGIEQNIIYFKINDEDYLLHIDTTHIRQLSKYQAGQDEFRDNKDKQQKKLSESKLHTIQEQFSSFNLDHNLTDGAKRLLEEFDKFSRKTDGYDKSDYFLFVNHLAKQLTGKNLKDI